MPFDFYDKDIRDVIVAFHGALPRERNTEPSILERPNIEVKNKINQLDKSYFDNIILGAIILNTFVLCLKWYD